MLSVKKMIDIYVNHGLSEETWRMLYNMSWHNLISYDAWERFCNTCRGYEFDEGDGTTIIDTANDCKVVYKTDENGFWKKVD